MYNLVGNASPSVFLPAAPNTGVVGTNISPGTVENLTIDSLGNLLWYDSNSFSIYVSCFDVTTGTNNKYCNGNTTNIQGAVYLAVGPGSTIAASGDGADGSAAVILSGVSGNLIGVQSLAIDKSNNLFIGDTDATSKSRIRAVCFNGAPTGYYCHGNAPATPANATLHNIASGAYTNGASGAAYSGMNILTPTGLALDKQGNLYVTDTGYYFVTSTYKYSNALRVLCFNSAGGYCAQSGNAAGNVYNVAGGVTNVTGDSGSNLPLSGLLLSGGGPLVINQTTNDVFFGDSSASSIRMFTGY